MKKELFYGLLGFVTWTNIGCMTKGKIEGSAIYETSAAGNQVSLVKDTAANPQSSLIVLKPEEKNQIITGIGGAFTESSAYLLSQLSKAKRDSIILAYFGSEGARYSLARTHINSCDFSLSQYAYAMDPNDKELNSFTIEHDKTYLIPMIKAAMAASESGFNLVASPWTAPPWMKDNKQWVGGKLLPENYGVWALYFSKYIDAYKQEGIPVWGLTVENEPLGNGNNWESMNFTPLEMNDFVANHLGPTLEREGKPEVKILGYDQNREHLKEWVDVMYGDSLAARYFDGTAIHWYASTYKIFGDTLKYAKQKAPGKYLIQTEACVDAEVPHWKEDAWYWSKEATDWGWDWAPEADKYLHPKYVPVYRYARDIIGCLNNGVDGWIDWNMVLDKQGGPNWFKNWCVAPVIVDPEKDEVYFTPLYYSMVHFSRFIRPNAIRIGFENKDPELQVTAVANPDGSYAVVLLNETAQAIPISLQLGDKYLHFNISEKALQTIIINPA